MLRSSSRSRSAARTCLAGGNVLYLKGNDQVFTGETTIANATWTFDKVYADYLVMRATAANVTRKLTFDTRVLSPYMIPDAYEEATKSYVIQSELEIDHPALEITNGVACDTLTGRFDVVDYKPGNGSPELITIAFDQHCNGS